MPYSYAKAHTYIHKFYFANLQLNGTRCFSVPFKPGLRGEAAVPQPRLPPLFMYPPIHYFHTRYISDAIVLFCFSSIL